MFFRLLKNDLLHGILANLVMMVFIAISSMLSCASISLMYASTNQITYFMNDLGNVADLNFSMMNITKQDQQRVIDFLSEKGISDYQIEEDVNLPTSIMRYDGHEDVYSTGCFATTLPERYNLLFDEENQIPDIKEGFVGIPLSMKTQLDLSIGDTLTLERGDNSRTYEIQAFVRDSLYGSEMMGQKRLIFHPSDYQEQYQMTQDGEHAIVVSIKNAEHLEHLEYEMQQAGLPNYILVSKDTAYLSFLGLGIGSSAIMMMSGIILLCMSFLIIRFTILFQIENKYAEIGIMKAIGLRHTQIKPLYLSKYMGIALIGTVVGFLCSIPFSQLLKEMQAGVVPVMPGHTGTYLSMLVLIVILGMVYSVTSIVLRKLKKQSAMDAIRKGNEGESFQAVSRMQLARSRRLSLPLFLAGNELMAHVRNTLMMLFIYAFCLLLMLIPLTLKDSFQGNAFLQILKMTEGDLYTQQNGGTTVEKLKADQQKVLQDLKRYDPDVSVRIETMAGASIGEQGINTSCFLMKRADDNAGIIFDKGKAPILKNEIAMSSTLAKRYDKTVGDSIELSYDGISGSYLITGIYTSMMNLGNNMLAGIDVDYDYAYTSYLVINFSKDQAENTRLSEQVIQEYTDVQLIGSKEMMISFSGDMASQIGVISDVMMMIMLMIVLALTILFSKLQLIKGRKEIALMQSLGYQKGDIRRWQMWRSIIQAILATALGLLLHFLFTSRLLEAFFELMGMGKVHLQSDPLHAYVLYPILFILSIGIAQIIVNQTIAKWNVQNLSEE